MVVTKGEFTSHKTRALVCGLSCSRVRTHPPARVASRSASPQAIACSRGFHLFPLSSLGRCSFTPYRCRLPVGFLRVHSLSSASKPPPAPSDAVSSSPAADRPLSRLFLIQPPSPAKQRNERRFTLSLSTWAADPPGGRA